MDEYCAESKSPDTFVKAVHLQDDLGGICDNGYITGMILSKDLQ
jgi:hypothetical protein